MNGAEIIKQIANTLGCAVDSIWSMLPTIAYQQALGRCIKAIIFLVCAICLVAFAKVLIRPRQEAKDRGNYDKEESYSVVIVVCVTAAAMACVAALIIGLDAVMWVVSPDVQFISYLKSIVAVR